MGIMTVRFSVPANSTSANLLAGQNDEILARPSQITIALTGAATGLFATYQVGSRVAIDDQLIGDQNRFPLMPDDVVQQTFGGRGERQFLRVRNSTGGALVVQAKINSDPIA